MAFSHLMAQSTLETVGVVGLTPSVCNTFGINLLRGAFNVRWALTMKSTVSGHPSLGH